MVEQVVIIKHISINFH